MHFAVLFKRAQIKLQGMVGRKLEGDKVTLNLATTEMRD